MNDEIVSPYRQMMENEIAICANCVFSSCKEYNGYWTCSAKPRTVLAQARTDFVTGKKIPTEYKTEFCVLKNSDGNCKQFKKIAKPSTITLSPIKNRKMSTFKLKAKDLLMATDKESVFPCFFTYVGAFKFYEANDVVQHPQEGKEDMVLIDGRCPKRDEKIEIQLYKEQDIEIYDGIGDECP